MKELINKLMISGGTLCWRNGEDSDHHLLGYEFGFLLYVLGIHIVHDNFCFFILFILHTSNNFHDIIIYHQPLPSSINLSLWWTSMIHYIFFWSSSNRFNQKGEINLVCRSLLFLILSLLTIYPLDFFQWKCCRLIMF